MQDSQISDIEPNQEQKQLHQLQIPALTSKDIVVYESTFFPSIFFGKRSIRALLNERTQICAQLKLKPKAKTALKEPMIDQQSKQECFLTLIKIFKESPSSYDEFSFTIIQDCAAIYCFFSCDDRYVPLCKDCNVSIYLIIRQKRGRLVCSNSKCKKKLLGEFLRISEDKESSKNGSVRDIKSGGKEEKNQGKEGKRDLNEEERMAIKKAAKKIVS